MWNSQDFIHFFLSYTKILHFLQLSAEQGLCYKYSFM